MYKKPSLGLPYYFLLTFVTSEFEATLSTAKVYQSPVRLPCIVMEAILYTPTFPRAVNTGFRKKIPSPEKDLPISIIEIFPVERKHSTESPASSPTFQKLHESAASDSFVGQSSRAVTWQRQNSAHKKQTISPEAEVRRPESLRQTPPELSDAITKSKYVLLPFTLFDDVRHMPRGPKPEESEILLNLFPKTRAVSVTGPMLIVEAEVLPPQPWPLSVAGLPLYLTTREHDMGWSWGEFTGRGPRVLGDLDARHKLSESVLEAVIDHVDNKMTVQILAVSWTCGWWLVEVEPNTSMDDVPTVMARMLCRYTYRSMRPAHEAARRLKEPTDVVRDDSTYDMLLRPGVMVVCPALDFQGCPYPGPFLTTSGLKVQKGADTYMTVASHGFALGEEDVHHPAPQADGSSKIGQVEIRLGDTDIALVKLTSGMSYTNELFQNHLFPPMRVGQVRPYFEMVQAEALYMDNPFTGFRGGMFVGYRFEKLPSDEPVAAFPWVRQMWLWAGQGRTQEAEGSCGSVVVDKEAKAVCFYRFLAESVVALGVAATELARFGFEISA